MDGILKLDLDKEEKIALLTAERADGSSGLYWALHDGHTETVKVYMDAILNSDFDIDEKIGLLKVKDFDDYDGCYSALQEGHPDTFEAYMKAILLSKSLNSEQKIALLPKISDAPREFSWDLYKKNGHQIRDALESTTCAADEKILSLINVFSPKPEKGLQSKSIRKALEPSMGRLLQTVMSFDLLQSMSFGLAFCSLLASTISPDSDANSVVSFKDALDVLTDDDESIPNAFQDARS